MSTDQRQVSKEQVSKEQVSKGQTALVTGAAVRLGRAIALELAGEGYDIALHYHGSASAAVETQKAIRSLGVDCELFQKDLSDACDLVAFVEHVQQAMPDLTVLVNSASAYEHASIEKSDVALFDAQFSVNLRAPFFLSKGFALACKRGVIINICDNKIGFNQFDYAAYLLAKKSLAEMTKMCALEFAPDIRVNAVAPGVVLPASTRGQDYIDWRIQGIPLKKQGRVDHITGAVLSLLDNDFITGQILVVDGGESIANVGQNFAKYTSDV